MFQWHALGKHQLPICNVCCANTSVHTGLYVASDANTLVSDRANRQYHADAYIYVCSWCDESDVGRLDSNKFNM